MSYLSLGSPAFECLATLATCAYNMCTPSSHGLNRKPDLSACSVVWPALKTARGSRTWNQPTLLLSSQLGPTEDVIQITEYLWNDPHQQGTPHPAWSGEKLEALISSLAGILHFLFHWISAGPRH